MPGSRILELGEFEQVVVLAILRLDDHAYGVTIRKEICDCTDRRPTPGALFTTLDRLEEKGVLASRFGDPTPRRGGRAKRFFSVTPRGIEAVVRAQRSYRRLMNQITIPGFADA